MPKNTVNDWSTTASENTDIGGINIDEGAPAANINNAKREMMAQIKTALGVSFQAYDTTLQALADSNITTIGGTDVTLISGTVGTDQTIPKWDADGSLVDGFTVSNDNTLVGNSATALVTEGAAKGYVDNFFLDQLTETASSGNLTNTIPYFDPTDTASTLNFRDEDDMASDDALGVPSQQSVVAYVSNNAVGSNQTWQNVTGSRSTGTIYQNTTGRTIEVALRGSGGSSRTFDIGTDAGSLSPILDFSDSGSEGSSISLLIPDQTYYRMESGASVSSWWELR